MRFGSHLFVCRRSNRGAEVQVLFGSPGLTIDRTWETTCSAGRRRATSREQPKRRSGERARRWARMLAEGAYPSRAALARAEGVSRAAVTRALHRVGWSN